MKTKAEIDRQMACDLALAIGARWPDDTALSGCEQHALIAALARLLGYLVNRWVHHESHALAFADIQRLVVASAGPGRRRAKATTP